MQAAGRESELPCGAKAKRSVAEPDLALQGEVVFQEVSQASLTGEVGRVAASVCGDAAAAPGGTHDRVYEREPNVRIQLLLVCNDEVVVAEDLNRDDRVLVAPAERIVEAPGVPVESQTATDDARAILTGLREPLFDLPTNCDRSIQVAEPDPRAGGPVSKSLVAAGSVDAGLLVVVAGRA